MQAGATVGFERARGVGVHGKRVGDVIQQAETRGDAVFALAEVTSIVQLVVVVMLVTLEAHPGQCLQALGQGDLVLDEGGPGLEVFLVVGSRAGQGRAGLAQHRVEDVDRIGAGTGGRTLNDRAVVVVFIFDAGQQGVGEATCVEVAGQVELVVTVGPFELAVVEVAAKGLAISLQRIGFHGVALE
ncbi:hypothetical protein D3C79_696250 [compost metagenome]